MVFSFSNKDIAIIYGMNCNLRCKLCYVDFNANDRIETNSETLIEFICSYYKIHEIKSIIWSGWGELFVEKSFIPLLNEIAKIFPKIKHNIQTNGTIYQELSQINCWDVIESFSISIDGDRNNHDKNRGLNTYDKCMNFIKAISNKINLIQIRTLLTKENYEQMFTFQNELKSRFPNNELEFTLITPIANNIERLKMFEKASYFKLSNNQIPIYDEYEMKKLPSEYRELFENGICSSVYLTISNNKIYSCCELLYEIGDIGDDIKDILKKMNIAKKTRCNNCYLSQKKMNQIINHPN